MTDKAKEILRNHAEQLLRHVDEPDADLRTLCDQAEQSAELARAELTESTTVAAQPAEAHQ